MSQDFTSIGLCTVVTKTLLKENFEALRSAFAGDTPPSEPIPGQFYVDTSTEPWILYVYKDATDLWVEVTAISPSGDPLVEFIAALNNAEDPTEGSSLVGFDSETVQDALLREKYPTTFPCEAYLPAITRVTVVDTAGEYRHVPSIIVKSETHLVGTYLRNLTSGAESDPNQEIAIVRSSDNGTTWSAEVCELNSGTYAVNPLDPLSPSGTVQSEPFLLYDPIEDLEILTCMHRGVPEFNALYYCTREADSSSLWNNSRFIVNSVTGAISLSTDIATAPPTGYKLTIIYTIIIPNEFRNTIFPGTKTGSLPIFYINSHS